MIQKYGRGSIWWYNFGDVNDNEENITYKRRPCVIVSNNQNNLAINYVRKISSGHLYTKRDKTHK